jgi:uracil-DNA glycosylase
LSPFFSDVVIVQRQALAQAPLTVASSAPVSFASSSTNVAVAAPAQSAPVQHVPAGPGLLASLTEPGWTAALRDEFQKMYWTRLESFVESEYKKTTIFPPKHLIFNAFNSCPLDKVKVVILGQDPYINTAQAHGLCFSVQHGVAPPPSLVNIYKELVTDISGFSRPEHGCLQKWADQGVFMLNALLTVREKTPMSHAKHGWEDFTSRAIEIINERCDGVVFMLWGLPAQQKASRVDENKHLVLKASHPSPLSAHTGWFGTKHFSKANAWLASKGKAPIDWTL